MPPVTRIWGPGTRRKAAPLNSQYLWATYNTKNQVTGAPNAAGGFTYDLAGNVISDGVDQYVYDQEGRLCAVKSAGPAYTQYVYDAAGNRVAKGSLSGANAAAAFPPAGSTATPYCAAPTGSGFTLTALYLRGADGNQDVEFDGNGNWRHTNIFAAEGLTATYWNNAGTPTLSYNFSDWLGTKRLQATGNSPSMAEEITTSYPYGNIMTLSGTTGDATEHHFTGKERDTESGNGTPGTGNDYFGARYYASNMGRFMSPDPSGLFFADPTDPQSMNHYVYVQNNPLVNVDPNGLDCIYTSNLTSTSVSVETVRGDCRSDTDNGVFVDGTINVASYTAQVGSDGDVHLGYSYTSDDDSSGTGSDGSYTLTANSGSTDIGAAVAADPDPDATRINSLVQGVAQDTRSLPWLCNAGLTFRGQIPKTPFAVGLSLDKHGLKPSARAKVAANSSGVQFNLTTNGKKVGYQFSAPIVGTPFRGSVSTGNNQMTVGASRNLPFGGNTLNAGASLTFGYLGDANCRN